MDGLFGVEIRTLSGASWRIEGLLPSTLVVSLLARASRASAVPLSELCLVLGDRVIEPEEAVHSLAVLYIDEGTVLTAVRDASASSWPAAHGSLPQAAVCAGDIRREDLLFSSSFCEARTGLIGDTFVGGHRHGSVHDPTILRRSRSFGHVSHGHRSWQSMVLPQRPSTGQTERHTDMVSALLRGTAGSL